MRTLSKSPIGQQQPTSSTCVPTCIAMALGLGSSLVIHEMELMGFNLVEGITPRQEQLYLLTQGIGYERMLNQGLGLPDGSYLCEVPSLNLTGIFHCVFLFIEEGEPQVFDPNDGKVGKDWYPSDGFSSLPIMAFTKLDDFGDLRQ